MPSRSLFDAVIVGGSYAGLAAALALGRSLRTVLVVDSGQPCNRQTPHSHNMLTHDGAPPANIAAQAREQIQHYHTVTLRQDTATAVAHENGVFTIGMASGLRATARKLLFATGVTDLMPAIEGFAACWGISVLHCPYCHGYEVRQRPTGILGNGAAAYDMARLIANWTNDLTIFTGGVSTLAQEHTHALQQRGIRIVEAELRKIDHTGGTLHAVTDTEGRKYNLDALYARPAFRQHCDLPQHLGCALHDSGHLIVDEMQRTTVPGVYAAGDNTTPFRAVAAAIAAGTKAGAILNRDLIEETWAQESPLSPGAV